MGDSSKSIDEKTIKNKKRIQNHGEVFTPKRITKQMLALPGIDEACQNLTATFLEPAAGEGVFLIEVLKRKIKMVEEKYGENLGMYENYSLLALSTLYGVEILEDNARKCIINIYQAYYEAYQRQAKKHGKKAKIKVLKFITIKGENKAILLNAFEEKNKSDYEIGIRTANNRINEIICFYNS